MAGAAGAGPALASHSQVTYFEGSNTLLDPSTRPRAFEQMQHLGVRALRVELYWASVVPSRNSATRPSFDATNPANYDWGQYDALLAEAQRLHWPVLLTVTSPVPRWATSNHKAPYVTRPGQRDFQEFMTAVGRHYGSEVSIYSIWNEANHPAFLQPQWNSNGTPASPRIYRGLYQAGYAGLQAGRYRRTRGCSSARRPPRATRRSTSAAKGPRRCCTTWRRCCSCARPCASTPATRNPARAGRWRCPATPTTPTRSRRVPSTSSPNATTSRSARSRA